MKVIVRLQLCPVFPSLPFCAAPGVGAAPPSARPPPQPPAPLKNCTRSVANHAVFGVGLYLTASLVQQIGGWWAAGQAKI